MTPLVLVLYGVALAAAAVAVWRRPIVALYVFIVGLALHNLVLALLYDAGLRGWEIDVVQAWKEVLLAVAVARVGDGRDPRTHAAVSPAHSGLARARVRSRRLPLRAHPAGRAGRSGRHEGHPLRPPPRARPRRRVLPRPVADPEPRRAAPDRLDAARRRCRARRRRARRPLRGGRRVVARLRRRRLLPLRARVRLPRPRRPAGQLGVQHRRRPLPAARGELHQPAGDGVRARRRAPAVGDRLAGHAPPAAR